MPDKIKTWVKGQPSPYQLHDITHFPDWHELIVWDAFFNNLASSLMIVSCLTWLAGPPVYTAILPIALSFTLLILFIDLVILVLDLGDPWRFFHSMRVMRFTSPLSVGVWGLSCMAIFLVPAVIFSWIAWSCAGSDSIAYAFVIVLGNLFTTMAFLASIVVICYKGVVFSCTSQPGVKNARWLTPFMVSDSLLMGLCFYILVALSVSHTAARPMLLPLLTLIIARCITFGLLWQDVKTRARKVYDKENVLIAWAIYGVCGALAFILACFGVFGLALAALLCLGCSVVERYWVIGLARPV